MSKLLDFKIKNLSIGIFIFLLGVGATLSAINLFNLEFNKSKENSISINAAPPLNKIVSSTNHPRFLNMEDSFNNFSKQVKKLFDQDYFNNSGFHDDSFLNEFEFDMNNKITIKKEEDQRFKYIKIMSEGFDKDSIQVGIKDNMVNISGTTKEYKESNNNNSNSKSSYFSTFQKSFNVPAGVDESKVKFEFSDDEIIVKFPKIL